MRNSSTRKSLAVLIFLAVLALVVVGCSSPGTKATGPSVKVGEAVKIDNLRFTVTAVNKVKEVGAAGNSFKIKDGDFVVVDMLVENVGQKASSFDGEMAKCYDADNQLYELNLEAAAAACNATGEEYQNLWFGSLEPGAKAKTKAIFEIPADIKGLKVELRSAEIGSENLALVSLGI